MFKIWVYWIEQTEICNIFFKVVIEIDKQYNNLKLLIIILLLNKEEK
mgnify:CR=1 FL=1